MINTIRKNSVIKLALGTIPIKHSYTALLSTIIPILLNIMIDLLACDKIRHILFPFHFGFEIYFQAIDAIIKI